jgi:succinoglycan biosynthesis transport protein ExoP
MTAPMDRYREAGAQALDLRGYLSVLNRRKWLILLVLIATATSALLFSVRKESVYKADVELLLRSRDSENIAGAGNVVVPDRKRDLENEVKVIESRSVENDIAQRLHQRIRVNASATSDISDVITVSTNAGDPDAAAKNANDFAEAYLEWRRTQRVNDLLSGGEEVQKHIDDLQGQIDGINAPLAALDARLATAPSSQREALNAQRSDLSTRLEPQITTLSNQQAFYRKQLDELQLSSGLATTGGIQLLTAAETPTSPVSPKPLRDGILAGVLGLMLGVGAAFLIELLDESIKGKDELERVTNLPTLALVPELTSWREKDAAYLVTAQDPKSAAAEAYRALRTSVKFLGLDRPAQVIQVTSMSQGEGKTTTVANLAITLAQAGDRVAVVCCDLRRPRVHEFLQCTNKVGFTSVLLGETTTSLALQKVGGNDRLELLASGPQPPNPSELLSWPRTEEIIRGLLADHDYVLIDSPPTLPVTDALVISRVADATLLVAKVGQTKRRQVHRAVELLAQVGAPVVGTVLNGVESQDTYAYRGYAYYGQPDPAAEPRRWGRRAVEAPEATVDR